MPTSITKRPPGARCAAALRKHATCSACEVRFEMVLNTRYTSENSPSTRVSAKEPTATSRSAPPSFARSWATMSGESSIPATSTPRAANGTAMRPVPIPNSSARPEPASPANTSTTGSTTSGANIAAEVSS